MQTTIKIELRSVYGKVTAYPVCDAALTFANMVNTRTLTRAALMHILHLGFTVVTVCPITKRETGRYNPLDAGYSSTLPMVA